MNYLYKLLNADPAIVMYADKPSDKYSWENLKFLFRVLQETSALTLQNRVIVMETMRELTELIIWNDRHNQGYFDYFMEHRLAQYYLVLLQVFSREYNAKCCAQVLSMLVLLVENLTVQQSLYQLLSNEYLNNVIRWGRCLSYNPDRWMGELDEAMANYVTLLRILGSKLNTVTLPMFYTKTFPLYDEALRLLTYPGDSMVRTQARNLSLKVLQLPDEHYFVSEPSVNVFKNLFKMMFEWCLYVNKQNIDYLFEEFEDVLYYIGDVFDAASEEVQAMLATQLDIWLVHPLSSQFTDQQTEQNFEVDNVYNFKLYPGARVVDVSLSLLLISSVETIIKSPIVANIILLRVCDCQTPESLLKFSDEQPRRSRARSIVSPNEEVKVDRDSFQAPQQQTALLGKFIWRLFRDSNLDQKPTAFAALFLNVMVDSHADLELLKACSLSKFSSTMRHQLVNELVSDEPLVKGSVSIPQRPHSHRRQPSNSVTLDNLGPLDSKAGSPVHDSHPHIRLEANLKVSISKIQQPEVDRHADYHKDTVQMMLMYLIEAVRSDTLSSVPAVVLTIDLIYKLVKSTFFKLNDDDQLLWDQLESLVQDQEDSEVVEFSMNRNKSIFKSMIFQKQDKNSEAKQQLKKQLQIRMS